METANGSSDSWAAAMWRKRLLILTAGASFGPALALLYIFSKWWCEPAAKYPDLHTPGATGAIACGWLGLAAALDLVRQVARRDRRSPNVVWLSVGIAGGCASGLFGIWTTWLTPLRPWVLLASGPAVAGMFLLLYRCRQAFLVRLFGCGFVLAGLVLFAFALREVLITASMTGWAKTGGRITDSGASGQRASKFMKKVLAYEYVVEGRRYTGTEDSWKSSRMRKGWHRNLYRVNASYGWNTEVAVYYDPAHPENAVLRPGLSYATVFVLRASLLGILGGMALLVASAQLRQAKSPMIRSGGIVGTAAAGVGGDCAKPWTTRVAFTLLVVCGVSVIVGIRPISPAAMQIVDIDKVPATSDAFLQRGYDLLRSGQAGAAANNFTRALNVDPNDAVAYFNRGHAHMKAGKFPLAIDDWRKAMELDWRVALHAYYVCRQLPAVDKELGPVVVSTARNHLSDLEAVSGYAVYGGGAPGDFYTASLILADHAAEDDFLKMTEDPNAMVRAMGLICLARKDLARHEKAIRLFSSDTAEVRYVPMGCMVDSISLAVLAKSILQDPNTLQYWDPEKVAWLWRERSE